MSDARDAYLRELYAQRAAIQAAIDTIKWVADSDKTVRIVPKPVDEKTGDEEGSA